MDSEKKQNLARYIGVKIIHAEPMERGSFNAEKGVSVPPDDTNYQDDGYKVIYEDGYSSWSPKEVFEKAYRRFGSEKNTVTQEDVDNFIANVDISTIGEKTTIVVATMVNGFTITESSSCVDPANYDQAYGAEICMDKIKDKLWFLLGFLLQSCVKGLNNK